MYLCMYAHTGFVCAVLCIYWYMLYCTGMYCTVPTSIYCTVQVFVCMHLYACECTVVSIGKYIYALLLLLYEYSDQYK